MPHLLIDDFGDATLWSALDPGSAPSAELTVADDPLHSGYLPDEASVRVEASAAATDHFLTRSLGPLDLGDFDDLQLWFRASVPMDGSPARPIRLRLQLGSPALPVGAPGNDWHRYLPAPQADRWQFVRVSLDDLDPLVAGAVDEIRLTCVGTTSSWTAWLDDLLACRTEMIADVDAALIELLDGQLVLGGGPVPAQVHLPGAASPAEPWLRVVHHRVSWSDARTTGQRPRTDYTDDGYRLRPESVAYDLDYRIEAATTDRTEQTQLLEFALEVLGPRRGLLVNGARLPLDRLPVPSRHEEPTDVPGLHYRVAARHDRGTHQPVVPVLEPVYTDDLLS